MKSVALCCNLPWTLNKFQKLHLCLYCRFHRCFVSKDILWAKETFDKVWVLLSINLLKLNFSSSSCAGTFKKLVPTESFRRVTNCYYIHRVLFFKIIQLKHLRFTFRFLIFLAHPLSAYVIYFHCLRYLHCNEVEVLREIKLRTMLCYSWLYLLRTLSASLDVVVTDKMRAWCVPGCSCDW